MSKGGPSAALVRTASTLAVDAATLEVAAAWREAGVPCILLKGPALSEWLHDGELAYGDADLLVREEDVAGAERVLAELGYEPCAPGLAGEGPDRHARPWQRRRDGMAVDVHRTLPGIPPAPPAQVWRAVSRRVETMRLLGGELTILDEGARALLVALHAAHHVRGERKPVLHVQAAVARLPFAVWRDAAALAGEVEAIERFATGLRRCPAGEDLAAQLGLPPVELTTEVRRPGGPAPLVLGFERLAAARGVRARARLVLAELLPAAEWLRFADPLAKRGRRGLAVAYVRRGWRLLRYAWPSYIRWRRARRPA